jgi:tetratricopeptide (TPR) repeat protein
MASTRHTRNIRFFIDDAVARLANDKTVSALGRLWKLIPKLEEAQHGEDHFWSAYARYHLAVTFDRQTAHQEAAQMLRECVQRFHDVTEPAVARLIDTATTAAGIAALRAGDHQGALQDFDRAVARLQDARAFLDRRALASAMLNRAAAVRRADRIEETAAAYDAVHERFGEDDDPQVCQDVAVALHEKARALEVAGLEDRALNAFRVFVRECGWSRDPEIIPRVIQTLAKLPIEEGRAAFDRQGEKVARRLARFQVELGTAHLQRGAIEEALLELAGAILVLQRNPRGEDRFWLAQALHNRGMALQRAARNHEAYRALVEVSSRFAGEGESEIERLVVSALINAAVAAGDGRRFDAALECLDGAILRRQAAATMDDRRVLANAMYNRATMLRIAGRTDEAVRAFEAIAERFGEDCDPRVYHFVGLALYNKATGLAEANQVERSMPAFRAMVEACWQSADPLLRERAAGAQLGLAGQLLLLGQREANLTALAQLVAAFGADPEPAVQKTVGRALLAYAPLVTRLPPAAHARTSPYNRQMYLTLWQDLRKHPAALGRAIEDHDRMLEGLTAAAAKEHSEAMAVLEVFWREGRSFALALRSFSGESLEWAWDSSSEFPTRGLIAFPGYRGVSRMRAAVDPRIPMLTISNPAPRFISGVGAPQLELDNGLWDSAARVLIRHAPIIILYLEAMSPGVFRELNMIVEEGRQGSTVLVVSAAVAVHLPVDVRRAAHPPRKDQPVDPAVRCFGLVLAPEDLPPHEGQPLPAVTRVLERLALQPATDSRRP